MLAPVGASLRCAAGHSFDIARQGYVSLLTGRGTNHRSDTADMVAARNRVFEAGLYAPIVSAVSAACVGATMILDAGGGPGQYLAAALDAAEDTALGVGLDLSRYCARSAARRHPRGFSVVADLWQGIPIQDGVADAVLSIFAPRNASEVARVLAPGGRWIIVTPEPGHLAEVVESMHMLSVGEGKGERLAHELAVDFTDATASRVTESIDVAESELVDVAAMGPAAFHRTRDQLAASAAALAAGGPVSATLDVTISVAQRR
ncbi:methyltransferase domain-containing protein [Gordonia hydrophobica]|uniref:Methyltransferase domain-containing protein n=1 Tax=Gordonia hydrophobica TaxID=40516 RepID=A0ABZ2U217_9ACTN|nr:methyltransferase domain-containing protein [Gordonia hydrophobica]MBM7366810.1 23S rRNA (guanine745-N1)-methyltransferase [Gordonia hydrophobica]